MGQSQSTACLSIEKEMDNEDLVCGSLYERSMEEALKKARGNKETSRLIKK